MNDEAATETELTPEQAAGLIEAGAELIDVRRAYEWEGGRIAGSRNIDLTELTAAAETIRRDRPVVFVCRSGERSGMAADAFDQAGYDAHNLAGGMIAWVEAGRALEPADGDVRTPLPPS